MTTTPMIRSVLAAALAVAILAPAAAVAASNTSAPTAAPTPAGAAATVPGYRLGPKDLVEIRVFEVPELNVERRVEDNGAVSLPLIGDVQVQGLTPEQFAEQLSELLMARYVKRASVSVEIREFRSRPISVVGAVKRPGDLAFSGRWTLLQAIAASGGLEDGHGDTIYVLRTAENGLTAQLEVDVRQLMLDGDPLANIPVLAGDLINVPAAVDVTIFCLGAVERPGAVTFKSTQRISLLSAIARAGGLTDLASKSITIRRANPDGTDTEIDVDYKKIVKGKAEDPRLEPDDVVLVKEKLF